MSTKGDRFLSLALRPVDYIVFAAAVLASVLIARIFAAIYPPALAWWFWMVIPPLSFLSGVHLLIIVATSKYREDMTNQIYGGMVHGEGQAIAGALRRYKSEPEYQDEQSEAAPKVAVGTNTRNRLVLKGK